ncbi:MAG: hypothetical protein K1X66_03735 [Verrucomicrobiae bacterium]|nr:hypothetical protein [Verrucomicrobiae bacterium]
MAAPKTLINLARRARYARTPAGRVDEALRLRRTLSRLQKEYQSASDLFQEKTATHERLLAEYHKLPPRWKENALPGLDKAREEMDDARHALSRISNRYADLRSQAEVVDVIAAKHAANVIKRVTKTGSLAKVKEIAGIARRAADEASNRLRYATERAEACTNTVQRDRIRIASLKSERDDLIALRDARVSPPDLPPGSPERRFWDMARAKEDHAIRTINIELGEAQRVADYGARDLAQAEARVSEAQRKADFLAQKATDAEAEVAIAEATLGKGGVGSLALVAIPGTINHELPPHPVGEAIKGVAEAGLTAVEFVSDAKTGAINVAGAVGTLGYKRDLGDTINRLEENVIEGAASVGGKKLGKIFEQFEQQTAAGLGRMENSIKDGSFQAGLGL